MNVHVSFRHMESSDMARDYAVSKLERVTDKYVQGRIDADVVFRNAMRDAHVGLVRRWLVWAAVTTGAGILIGLLFNLFIGRERDEMRIYVAALGTVTFASGAGAAPVIQG